MPSSSVIFDPEVPDRALDREVSKVDDAFADTGKIEPEVGDVQGDIGLDGVGGVGDGGGIGPTGPGGASPLTSLSSKLPKPIAGVTAASAMPVALAGAVGAGMAKAMHAASARLKTSTSILKAAWNNIWRPLGDKLDEMFVRDISRDIFQETKNFGKAIRQGDWLRGFAELKTGVDFDEDTLAQKVGAAVGFLLSPGNPIAMRVWSGLAQDISNQFSSINWGGVIPDPNWPRILTTPPWQLVLEWPGWDRFVTGVDLGSMIDVPDWLSGGGGGPLASPASFAPPGETGLLDPTRTSIHGSELGGRQFTADRTLENERRRSTVMGGGLQGGGRVTRSGVARVHRGELVSDPDRLVSELADAVNQLQPGGGGRSGDMSGVRKDIQNLHRDLQRDIQRLARVMKSTSIQIDRAEFGRLTTETRNDNVFDTDPTAD